ncbi:gamma carbonic anhydrase family protein [Nocardioides insulae]|uniref:gamma carbonic anhydrase family protein n=1 Tax=Nocardioides insulae TaxID=394734 RepID=UPI000421DFD9|nr:gamma carbonic anhydrase family protein [Nocardioides insulae]
MNLFEYEGVRPTIHPEAWVAPTATLIGDVRLGPGVSIWYGAVLRGDVGPIIIEEGTNVQDNSVLHVMTGHRLEIGAHSTIAHGCVVHGRRIGSRTLIGNGATVLDHSVIGDGCMVAAGALVSPGMEVPDGQLVVGVPAKVKGPIEEGSNAYEILQRNAPGYVELAARHRAGTRRVD